MSQPPRFELPFTDGKGVITRPWYRFLWDLASAAGSLTVSTTSRILGRASAGAGAAEELTLSQVLDFIGSAAQGDILYRDATGWARLPANTAGKLLTTNGVAANPSWATTSSLSGVMSFQGSATVTGSAATDLTISGLDLDAYGVIYLEIKADNATGSVVNFSIYFNGDTTATNYYNERISSTGGVVTGTGGNTGEFSTNIAGNQSVTMQAWIRRNFDGYIRSQFINTRGAASARVINYGWHFYDVSTNITSVTLHSSGANSLSVGTLINVWAIKSA